MRASRLDRLDGAADPRAVVLAWLAEARTFATLVHYVQGLLGQPPDRWPLALLPRQAAAHVQRAMHGFRELEVLRAIDNAVGEVVFLVEVVLLVNAITDEHQREVALRCHLLIAKMCALALEPDTPDVGEPQAIEDHTSVAERLEAWLGAVTAQAKDAACAEEARRLLEQRYLDGQSALFPRTADRWEAARDAMGEIAGLAVGGLGQTGAAAPDGRDRADAMLQASQLADAARAATLGLLGDSRGARAVMARRLASDRRRRTERHDEGEVPRGGN